MEAATRWLEGQMGEMAFPCWWQDTIGKHGLDTRRGRKRRATAVAKVLSGCGVCLLLCVAVRAAWCSDGQGEWKWKWKWEGSDATLNARPSDADVRAMHLERVRWGSAPAGNPWRGAGRRWRSDVMVSASGCGGTLVRAARVGSRVRMRYVERARNGSMTDAAPDGVDVVVGTRQAIHAERALVGACAGDVLSLPYYMRGARSLTLYVERVALPVAEGRGGPGQGEGWGKEDMEEEMAVVDVAGREMQMVGGRRGSSCTRTCRRKGLTCEARLFGVVNNCARLRAAFACTRCETAAVGTQGGDMPAWVSLSAPVGHARGVCLASPAVRSSRCDATYAHTRRLCPCLRAGRLAALENERGSL